MKKITQYYDVPVCNPVTGAIELARMEVTVDFEAIAVQLGPKARASKKQRAAALFGAVIVRPVYPRKLKCP